MKSIKNLLCLMNCQNPLSSDDACMKHKTKVDVFFFLLVCLMDYSKYNKRICIKLFTRGVSLAKD